MAPRTERALLAAIVVVALLLRVVYVLALRDSPYFEEPILDPAYHVDWARSLARGETFEPGPFFRAPLYPWFLGSVFALLGDGLLAPRLIQCLLGVATVVLTWAIGRRAFGPREGLLAGACAGTSWVLIYFDGELLLPTLVVPLYLAALLGSLGLGEGSTRRRLLLSGVLWGIATLARPNVLLLAPILALWLLRSSSRPALGLRAAAFLALGWLLPVLPISTYNAVVGHEVVLVSTQGGVNFWIGNHPGADGTSARVPGTSGSDFRATHEEAWALAEREAGRELSAGQVSRHYAGKAWDFVFSEPGRSTTLLTRKLGLFWQDAEVGNNQPVRGTAWYHAPWMRFSSLPFWLLAPLGLIGLALALRRRELLPLSGFVVVFCASVVAFFVCSRFRAPILPVLMVFAAHALVWCHDSWRAGRRRPVALAGIALLVLSTVSLVTGAGRALDRARGLSHLAVGHDLAGQPGAARPLHEQALALASGDEDLRLAYADHLEGQGDRAGALGEVRSVLVDSPDHLDARAKLLGLLSRDRRYPKLLAQADQLIDRAPELTTGHYYRGAALVGLQRHPEALLAFQRARALDPAGSRAQMVLGQLLQAAGRGDEALVCLEEAVLNDHFPGARRQRVQAHVALARLLAARGQAERAREVARLLLQREPDAPESSSLAGEVGG